MVMQLVLFPMIFLSGAMFPLTGLPRWLAALTRINPLTYAVDPLRDVVFAAQQMPAAARVRSPPAWSFLATSCRSGASWPSWGHSPPSS